MPVLAENCETIFWNILCMSMSSRISIILCVGGNLTIAIYNIINTNYIVKLISDQTVIVSKL